MLQSERLSKVEQYIREHEFASVNDLVDEFGVSKATIHRDLDTVCKNHQDIVLTHGGAMCMKDKVNHEAPYLQKRVLHKEEKIRIAKMAASMVQEESTIILDSGTTNREMVPFLSKMKNIHVVTNDIIIAAELAGSRDLDITVCGGNLRKGFFTLRGYQAENFVKELRCDICFLNTDSIDLQRGCMITNMDEVKFKRNIVRAANKVVVLCDSSKFVNMSFVTVCDFVSISLMITDTGLDQETAEKLRQMNVNLMMV